MKAAVLTEIDAPLTLAEVGLTKLAYGQVQVKVLASGICGAQLLEIGGHKGNARFIPHLLGHEGCGIVEKIGDGVTRVEVGQKAVMHWRPSAGIDSAFPRYKFKGSEIQSGKVTTFNEQSIVSENRLTPVPHDTPNELCALLGCGLSTALATVENDADIKFGESVLIIGCGGLGSNLIRACSMRRASPIFALDLHEHKQALAYQMGASHFISVTAGDWRKSAIMQGMRFDAIIDTAGASLTMETALPLLAPGGRYIMVGQPRPTESVLMANANHMFEGHGKTIKATQGGQFRPDLDIPRYVRLWKAGLLDLENVITHRIPLSKINEGIQLVRNGEAGRILIEMT